MSDRALLGEKRLLLVGVFLVVLGVIAMATPAVAGNAVVIVIGILLLLTGGAQVFQGYREEALSRKIMPLVLGIITAIGGIAVLLHPWIGLKVLTLIMAAFFVVEGIWKVVTSFAYRPAQGWIAMLISGLLALVLAFLIWKQWPLSEMYAVGVLVGVDLLVTGVSMIVLAWTLRSLKKAVTEAAAPAK
jgi:uncharacterized membrane protein HdeD (DUF308 family)